ncbi:ArsR/SmtB family transcription factor [Sporosalibacterium faouarense]|uniref:ArsR/SmtB family transcription factor n=1 Tax=Sporosalibacterium faouarense TaxID=516123 RepID=UPI00141C35D3|nr:metalloregulator ArsR/SmtB family transcription factor [Sporosalibacterium faouarense]MTI49736.1 helix-turn-helix transcriptional regulator [Bacillota bacterium]
MKFDMKELEDKAELLKAIAHPIRLCIVRGLMQEEGRNVTNIQTCLSIPQSTVSQHLAKLKSAGIVEGRRSGTEVNYYVINEDVRNVLNHIF